MSNILTRLRFYNPPDRTIDIQRQIAADIHEAADEIESLRKSLARMVAAFKPFTMKPVGAPNSSVRTEQDEQIAAHAEARKVLGLNEGSKWIDPALLLK